MESILLKDLNSFVFELEVGYDHLIPKDNLKTVKKLCKSLKKKEELDLWIESNKTIFDNVKDDLRNIFGKIKNGEKIKSDKFNFFSNFIFFGLDFKLFEKEDKNSKKELCIFLIKIYKTLEIIQNDDIKTEEGEEIYKKHISCFFNKRTEEEKKPTYVPPKFIPKNESENQNGDFLKNILGLDINNLNMPSKFQDLTKSLLNDIKTGDLDVKSILNGILKNDKTEMDKIKNKLNEKYDLEELEKDKDIQEFKNQFSNNFFKN